MTAGRFQEVDFDLLADYVGGALDGTPEQAVVERLISTTPQWRDAHRALVQAMDPVQASLNQWGAEQPVMPEEVTARLAAALEAATPETAVSEAATLEAATPSASPAAQDTPPPAQDTVRRACVPPTGDTPAVGGPARGDTPAGAGRGPAGPGLRPGGRPDSGGRFPTKRRRQWVRLAGPALVTAAVVAFGVVGLTTWLASPNEGQGDTASTSGGSLPSTPFPEQATDASGPHVLLDTAPQRLLASGLDYAPATLVADVATVSRAIGSGKELDILGSPPGSTRSNRAPTGDPAPAGPMSGASVPADLLRLADRSALSACLATVTGEHGRGQVTVEVVDYASFEGRPALVIVFSDATGARWAWVSGPDCGLPGSAADTRHRARVG